MIDVSDLAIIPARRGDMQMTEEQASEILAMTTVKSSVADGVVGSIFLQISQLTIERNVSDQCYAFLGGLW